MYAVKSMAYAQNQTETYHSICYRYRTRADIDLGSGATERRLKYNYIMGNLNFIFLISSTKADEDITYTVIKSESFKDQISRN